MALHYLLDGYNLLFAMREIPKGTWQEKRAHLIAAIQKAKPQGNNALTIIFDSREGGGSKTTVGSLSIVYTAGETADDRIIDMVRTAANPRTYVVVTNDKGIRIMLKGTGAQVMDATDFLKIRSRPHAHEYCERGEVDADLVTEELRRKWLS